MQKATVLKTRRLPFSFPIFSRGITFEQFAFTTVLLTYGLIVLGGAVRATNSGTACPDWPLCHGQLFPPMEEHVLIEWSHRLAASVVGLLIAGTALWAWRRRRADRLVMAAAGLAIVLLGAQVLVGAATVDTETDADVVALHLSIALTLFATLIVLALAPSRASSARASAFPVFPATVAAGAFILVISGAYVSQEGAGLVYPDWPLFDGKLVSSGGRLADLHYLHRVLAGFLGVLMLWLVIRTWRYERSAVLVASVALALVIYVAQVLAGAANIWFELATSVRILHLALASALWAVLVFSAAWSYLNPSAPKGVARA